MTSCSECTIAPPYHVDPLKVKAMTECDGRACVIICLAMGKLTRDDAKKSKCSMNYANGCKHNVKLNLVDPKRP